MIFDVVFECQRQQGNRPFNTTLVVLIVGVNFIDSASEKQFSVEIGKKWFRGRLTTPSLKNGFVRTTDLVGSGGG